MITYLRLIYEFFKVGLFSVGGGLATLPFLYEMSDKTRWFTHRDVADMIAISESTPGAIGINMSTYAGFKTAGPLGGILASIGLAMPCIIIIIIIARMLDKFRSNKYVDRAFYGLRPASLALISAAGINVAKTALINIDGFLASKAVTDLILVKPVILFVVIFLAARKLKWHPVAFIAISAVVGIIFKF